MNRHFTLSKALTVILLHIGIALRQSAFAQTFTIEESYNSSTHKTTFTIKRSGSSLPQQTIKYRTVNLSAYAGQHYTAVSGDYTFPANETTKTVEVTESSAGTAAYQYQSSTTRSYRFEVLDINGFELQHYDRSMTTGAQFSADKVSKEITDLVYFNGSTYASGLSSGKYLDVSFTPPSGYVEANDNNGLVGYVLIDDSYDYATKPATVSTSTLISSTNATASYLNSLGYKIYATVCFSEKERDDGYQYVQILAGTSSASYDGADPNGSVNDPSYSVYKACFELADGANSTGKAFFPHRYDCETRTSPTGCNQSSSHTEFNLAAGKLWKQKYKSGYQADNSGSLVFNANVANITTRFDAAGDNDDTWGYKDLFVRMALCDATNPTLLNNSTAGIAVSAGPYIKGNTFYISVPFNEIVHVSGAYKQLYTSWGNVEYVAGDNTNVITYKGTINATAGTTLAITGIRNSLFNDLAGNYFQGSDNSFNKTFNGVTCTESYTLAATNTEFTGLQSEYVVSNTAIEPHPTVYFYKGKKETANKVQLTENTNYTLSWANNNAAGNGRVTATGTGIYTGSASATFPIRWSTYTFSFHGNGSIGIPAIGTMSNQVFQYGVAQNLTTNAFSREGFTFAGWNTQPDGNGTAYTNGQSIIGLTTDDGAVIDLYAQWALIPWTGSGDSEDDPYMILYASQLDLLATNVNSGNNYSGKFFKLDADITYGHTTVWNDATSTENNYTAIGTSTNNFRGTFDGDNHTISGIRIYTTNDYQGLFGYVYSGSTVKNIALANSIIIGGDYVGSIAGKNEYGTITNCRIGNDVTIGVENDDKDYHGGIVGYQYDGTVSGSVIAASVNGLWYCGGIAGICVFTTLKDCLYTGTVANGSWKGAITGNNNNSTLTNNYYTTDGIGGVNGSDCDGARRARTITLGEHVGIAGDQTAYDVSGLTAIGTTVLSHTAGNTTTIYSGATQDVTLSDAAPQGCVVTSYSLNGTPLAGNTFTMPDSDVTVSATIGVSYIDADGNEQICTDYTLIESSTGSAVILGAAVTETWYAVSGNVNITSSDEALILYGAAHLILMDDATLTVEGSQPISAYGSLSIYGQSLGTGSLVATGSDIAIYVDILPNAPVANDGSLTINGGIVTAASGSDGISATNDITINGGVVSAGGNGLKTIGTLTLGWRNATDRIYASSYNGDNGVAVKSGQYLSDGTAVYSGSLSDTQIDALAGKTLQPAVALTLPKYVDATSGVLVQEGRTACVLPDANVTIAAEGCTLADVTVGGEAATDNGDGTWSFIMPATDATVSATVTAIDFTTGHAGTEGDPYIIMYRSQLDLLATRVNGGESYNGKFLKLGADIAYDPNDLDDNGENYTAIGTMVNYRYFKGSFDGDGHIVSGIRINKTGQTDADKKQGLFGYVNYAFIKNVVLSDASITGYTQVGGILGDFQSSTTIQNCFVLNSHIIATNSNTTNRGVIAGYDDKDITLIENYYYNCTVNGASTNVGANGSDRDGARGVNKLTLCEHVIATPAAAVTYQGNSYYADGTSVTLSVEEGYTLNGSLIVKDANNNDVALTGGDTFEMPASDVSVNADIIVNPLPEVTVTNNVQTICMDNQIQEMEIIYSNGTIESVTGLPENVNWSDTPSGATIFGAPAEYGTFNATVTVTSDQGCGTATADVTITVKPNPEVTVSNNFQTVCENSAITAMEITATHATIENVTGLPTGVSWSKDSSGATGTISGTPTASGTYNVTVTVNSDQTPSCGIAYAYVRITVNPLPEVTVTNDNQTVCAGDAIVAMEITATNGTIANVEGLPAGLTWSGTMISGTPTVTGTFNVTVTVSSDQTPDCGEETATATITVNPLPEAYTLDITGYGDSDGGWNLIASPLAESIAATEVGNLVAETASDFDLYRFNQAANMEWENWKQEESEHYHFNLESGQGYLYASKEDVTLIFTGEPYSDNGEVRLSKTTGVDFEGWNLVGNPFSDTAYIERPFYIMNSSGSEIIAAADVEQNSIAPMEGVFVIATEDGETLTFTTEAPSKSGKGLALNLSQGRGVIDRAIVRFGEGQQLPKFQLRESSTKVYIPQDNKDYAVVNVGRDAMHCVSTEIPVHFKARENGVYTLTVSETFSSQLSAFSYLHLIDNLTGNDVDLLETQSYTFEAKVTDYASRFKLVFATGDADNSEDFAFISNGNIIINGEGTLQVIDVLGRVIVPVDGRTRCVPTDAMSAGVYVLRLINGEDVKTQKIVIK